MQPGLLKPVNLLRKKRWGIGRVAAVLLSVVVPGGRKARGVAAVLLSVVLPGPIGFINSSLARDAFHHEPEVSGAKTWMVSGDFLAEEKSGPDGGTTPSPFKKSSPPKEAIDPNVPVVGKAPSTTPNPFSQEPVRESPTEKPREASQQSPPPGPSESPQASQPSTPKKPVQPGQNANAGVKETTEPKPPPTQEQIAHWIQQLGDDSYEVRQRATAELCQTGLAAAEALKEALKHPDLEVRRRARWILADVLEADHRQRLEKFLADPTGSPDHRLPLWRRFRELVGYDEGARKLFVAAQRAEPALLEVVEAGGTGAVESIRARLQQITQRMNFPNNIPYQPSLGTTVAFLFLASLPELELPQDLAENPYVFNLVHQPAFQQLLNGPEETQKAAARRLLGQWILRPTSPESVQSGMVHNRLQLAVQYRLQEGLVLAFEILQTKEPSKVPPYLNAYAVSAVGLLGGKPYAEHLVPMLGAEQECQRFSINNKEISIQVRDVALAWLIHLTDQKHAEYGMDQASQEFDRLRQIPQYYPNLSLFRYSEKTSRDQAIGQLKTWLASHPLPKSPEVPRRPAPPAKVPQEKSAKAQPAHAPLVPWGIRGAAVANPAAPDANSPNQEATQKFFLPRADRLLLRNLAHAQEAIQQRRFAEAARILGEILTDEKDYAFQPNGAEPLYRCLKSEAARLLSQLPPEGLQTYQTLYEPRAKKALQEAVVTRNMDQLLSVAENFFFTPSGAEALYLAGLGYLDRAQPVQAALVLERLRAHPQATQFEPMLSLLQAMSWYRAGELSAAESALVELPSTVRTRVVYLAGQQETLFAQPEQGLAWLRTKLGLPALVAGPEGWLFVHGTAAHNPSSNVGAPYLSPQAHWPVCEQRILAETAQQLRRNLLADWQPALAKLYPLVIGQKAVFRTATALRAVDLQTGRLLWEAPMEDPLRFFLQPYGAAPPSSGPGEEKISKSSDSQEPPAPATLQILPRLLLRGLGATQRASVPIQEEDWDGANLSPEKLRLVLSEGLQERFWDDTVFGLLSSDRHRVYGIEDVHFRFPLNLQRVVVTADGQRRPEPFLQKEYNLLVAHDINTGKALWEVGGPPDVEGMTLGGAYFLGPPIPLGGRLYVAALIDQETQLLELAPDTGQVLSQLALSGKSSETSSQRAMLLAMGLPIDRLRLSEVPTCMPAYADGMMVCRTGENHYVAVDLLTRSIRWIYEASQEEEEMEGTAAMVRMVPVALRRAYAAWKDAGNGWDQASITLGEGFVLLTPPQTDKLICLRLHDGQHVWSAPRRDGLFVAAVAQGLVLVVGRESLWAVRLKDGQPAWPTGSIALPADALPTGRGYRQGRFYYLPLSTAEVAVFDLQAGRLLARSRSPRGIIPGNLVACAGMILSQDVDGVYKWDILADRAKHTSTALAQSPHLLQAQLDQVEVLIAQGQLQEALKLLCQTKAEAGATAQTHSRFQQLVLLTIEDGFHQDPATFLLHLPQIETLLDQPEFQPQLLQQLAQAYQQQGQIEAAFEKYLTLVRLESEKTRQQEHRSTSHEVRHDRWIAGRLAELYHQAPAELRAKLDAQIAPWEEKERLEQFVQYFGFHPHVCAARIHLAQQQAQEGRMLQAEWLLQTVLEQGDPAEQRLAAVRLAELLRKAGRHEAAASLYQLLTGPWAQLSCADGKTGQEIFETLPADDPVRRFLSAASPWPAGLPKVEVLKQTRPQMYRCSVRLSSTSPSNPRFHVRFDPNQHQVEISHPSGKKLETISIPRPTIIGGVNYNFYSYSQGYQRGHGLIAWLGTCVAAVDLLSEPGQILWSQPIGTTTERQHPVFAMFVLGGRQQIRQASPFLANEPLPLVVTSHTVCFQQDRRLVAVDPLGPSNQPFLWSRRDIPPNADLLGDEEVLFVTGSDQKEATVLSTVDGRVLGTRRTPDIKERLIVLGRRILSWKTTQEACRAIMVDPWTQQTLWNRSFPTKSQPWVLPEGQLAVLDTSGRLSLLDLQTGQEVFHASVDPEPNLDSLIVLASPTQYLVIANRPFLSTGPMISFGYPMPNMMPVHGRITALERTTGNVLWSTEVREQRLLIDFPVDLPVLVFYTISQKQEKNQQGHIQQKIQEVLLCLDTRTGTLIHQSIKDGFSGFGYDIVADVENRNILLGTSRETVRLQYGQP